MTLLRTVIHYIKLHFTSSNSIPHVNEATKTSYIKVIFKGVMTRAKLSSLVCKF